MVKRKMKSEELKRTEGDWCECRIKCGTLFLKRRYARWRLMVGSYETKAME